MSARDGLSPFNHYFYLVGAGDPNSSVYVGSGDPNSSVYVGAGDPDSGPHACMTGTVQTESPPQCQV